MPMLKIITTFSLMLFVFAMTAAAQDAPDFSRWEKSMTEFEGRDKSTPQGEGKVLFIGSSSIRMWKTLAEDMAPHAVINRGFGGSQIEDSIHFADRIIFPYKPSAIFIYAGDNDIAAKKTPERVARDFKRFHALIQTEMPGTPVYFIAIKPSRRRWEMWPDMLKANALIERYISQSKNAVYVDTSSPMLDENGEVMNKLFIEDMLHMNAEGYSIWTSIVKPRLDAMSLIK